MRAFDAFEWEMNHLKVGFVYLLYNLIIMFGAVKSSKIPEPDSSQL